MPYREVSMLIKSVAIFVFACLLAACTAQRPQAGFPAGRWIDLSHDFSSDTIYWVTAEPFKRTTVAEGQTPGHTYINQPAFEELFERYSALCDFEEREINFKHEGNTLAYSIELNGKEYSPELPEWCESMEVE